MWSLDRVRRAATTVSTATALAALGTTLGACPTTSGGGNGSTSPTSSGASSGSASGGSGSASSGSGPSAAESGGSGGSGEDASGTEGSGSKVSGSEGMDGGAADTVVDAGSTQADGGISFTAQFATVSCTTPDHSLFPNGSKTTLNLSSRVATCSELASELAAFADASTDGGINGAELSALEMLVENSASLQFRLSASTPTLSPTTYTVQPPCGYFYGGPTFTAMAFYDAYNGSGMQSVSDQAASGTLTLTAVSATEIAGSYSVAFVTDPVVQDACNAWANKCASAINSNRTCLPDFDAGSLMVITGTFMVPICSPPVCPADGGM